MGISKKYFYLPKMFKPTGTKLLHYLIMLPKIMALYAFNATNSYIKGSQFPRKIIGISIEHAHLACSN